MHVRATSCLALLLFCVAPLHASERVDALLARSEARLGGLGGLNADPAELPKPPFGEALISPLNIATFLAGVGVAEGVNSQLLNDPMRLQEYFVSLGQPLTYIAFMIFDMSRYTISRSLYPLTTNPYTIRSHRDLNFIDKTGGYIALAGASTVLHLLFEIIYSPHFKKLQTASDATAFKHNLNNLLRENFLSTDRWIGRGIGTTTLLAAAVSQGYVAGLRMPLQEKIKSTIYRAIASRPLVADDLLLHTSYDGHGLYVENIIAKKNGAINHADLTKYLHQPIKLKKVTIMLPRFKLKGKYLAFTGASVGIMLHVLDMALFIEFDHLYTALLEQPLWQFIHAQRIAKLNATIKDICASLLRSHDSLPLSSSTPLSAAHDSLPLSSSMPLSAAHDSLPLSSSMPLSAAHDSLPLSSSMPLSAAHDSLPLSSSMPLSAAHDSLPLSSSMPLSAAHDSLPLSSSMPLSAAHDSLPLSSSTPDLQKLRSHLDQLSQSWFDYRMLFILKLLMSLRSWHDELMHQDRRFYQRLSFYRWLLKGGDYHDAQFLYNNHNWHAAPHRAEFQRTKTKMIKDMFYGFRQLDFFNYSFFGKTIAHQHFPAIIPPAKRQQYPRSTLALLQRIPSEREDFMAMFEQWGRAYGEKFETQRRRFITRYNAKTRKEFSKIYLTDKHSIGSLKRLPSSPFLAFDHEINDLHTLLHSVTKKANIQQLDNALAALKNYYADLSLRRDDSFLLDSKAQENARLAIAEHWEKIRQHLEQLPPTQRSLAQLLAERIELTMIFRFAYVSLGSYLLDSKHIYLKQED